MRRKLNSNDTELASFFDDVGNFLVPQDPYRYHDTVFYMTFYDKDGNLNEDARDFLGKFLDINRKSFDADCDVARMVISQRFASNTKTNYSGIYYWR